MKHFISAVTGFVVSFDDKEKIKQAESAGWEVVSEKTVAAKQAENEALLAEVLTARADAQDLADAKAQALDEAIGKRVSELHQAERKAKRDAAMVK